MLKKIKEHLTKRQEKITFLAEEHLYFYLGVEYQSVSERLRTFNTRLDNIKPEILETARQKGEDIHNCLENFLKNKPYNKNVYNKYEAEITKGLSYIHNKEEAGWKVLAIEQLVYDIPEKTAGTIDLILFHNDWKEIKIVDWKTGALRASNYLQMGFYKYLLRKSLGAKYKEIKITTELISLKIKK